MNLTIVVPSIRIEYWDDWIEAVHNSCKEHSFEIIFIGPSYNACIEKYKNIKYVRDFGHPNRCQQIGLLLAEGEIVTFGSDDCLYKEGAIDKCLDIYYKNDIDFLTTGYNEGGNVAVNNFSVRRCYGSGKNVNNNWVIFNSVFIGRDTIEKYSLDTSFAVTCIGHTDLACRVQATEGIKGAVLNENIMECSHMPGKTGDHGPVCDSQTLVDGPNFFTKYNSDEFPELFIKWNCWKNDSIPVWKDRFDD